MLSLEDLKQRIAERPWRAGLYAFVTLTAVTVVLVVADYALRPQSFPVRSLSFSGDFREVSEQELAAAVTDTVRGNFFLLDLESIRRHAEKVPWVRTATVRRQWPDGVLILFTEQRLVARWGQRAWLNDAGEVVDLGKRPGPDGLPVLSGPAGQSERVLDHFRQLNAILGPIGLSVAQLTLSARHSWSVVVSGGLQLVLGRELPEPKISRFARVYPKVFASSGARARRVDLRYTNGFTVEWTNRASAVRDSEILKTGLNED